MESNSPLRSFFRNLFRSYSEMNTREEIQRTEEYNEEKNHRTKELRWNMNGVIINAVLAVISLVVLIITIVQTNISADAVKVASNALTYQMKADTLKNIQDSVTFELQKQSLDLSIKSLQDTRRRYAAEHETFIEVRDFKVDFSNPAKNPDINFVISNYGRVALITSTLTGNDCARQQDSLQAKTSVFNQIKIKKADYSPTYIGEQTPKSKSLEFDVQLGRFKQVINESFIVYFGGEIKYINLTNKKRMKMSFLLSTKDLNIVKYNIIYMKNEADN